MPTHALVERAKKNHKLRVIVTLQPTPLSFRCVRSCN